MGMFSFDQLSQLKKLLIRHEGKKNKLYKCTADKWTIGVGRNIEENGLRDNEIELMLYNDITDTYHFLMKNYPWFTALDDCRASALIDMCFCLGGPRYKTFQRMNFALSQNQFNDAADELLDSRFAAQVGYRAEELAKMLRTGQWPNI